MGFMIIKGKRTYTNPNAKEDQFTPTEIAMFNSDTFKPEKASVADRGKQERHEECCSRFFDGPEHFEWYQWHIHKGKH